MKLTFPFFLFTLLLQGFLTNAQVCQRPRWVSDSPHFGDIIQMQFVDEKTGFIGDNVGDLYQTNDSGKTWNLYKSFYSPISCLFFKNKLEWYVVAGGTIYDSKNAGVSWDTVSNAYSLKGLWVTENNFMYAYSQQELQNGVLQLSKNGGKSWQIVNKNLPYQISQFQFLNDSTGIFLNGPEHGGGYYRIYRCDDFGATFNSILGQPFPGLFFANDSTCYQGYNSFDHTAFVSFDKGISWATTTTLPFPLYHFPQMGYIYPESFKYSYFIEYFVTADLGFTTINGPFERTTNAGHDWTSLTKRPFKNIQDVSFTDLDTGYVLTRPGYLYKTNNLGNTWSLYDTSVVPFQETKLFFNKNKQGFLFGTDNKLFRSEANAKNWIAVSLASTGNLLELYFPFKDTGYFLADKPVNQIGAALTLFKTINGGKNWSSLSFKSTDKFKSMQFLNELLGYITTDIAVYRTTDGGLTWTTISVPAGTTGNLVGSSFKDPSVGHLLTKLGVFTTTDGGQHWNKFAIKTYDNAKIVMSPFGDKFIIINPDLYQDRNIYLAETGDTVGKSRTFSPGNLTWVKFIDNEHVICLASDQLFMLDSISCAFGFIKNAVTTAVDFAEESEEQLYLFPNPMEFNATLNYTNELDRADYYILNVFDARGILQKTQALSPENNFEFKKENLLAGLYFYTISNANNNKVIRNKLVIR